MRLYTRIVERRSFTRAAQDIGLPRSTVTDAVKDIEARLGVTLLQRTTRHVSPTLEGEAYYRRCLSIIAEIEDAESAFGGVKPRGELRIDVHGSMLRRVLVPELPRFLKSYPDLHLHIGEGDRLVDLVREGVDCVIRAGALRDSTMVARQIAVMDEVTVVTMSEFGRTISLNGSGGTDHGRGSAMFVMGGAVNGGLYGSYPSGPLDDGPDGDLEVQNDFRRVLAEIVTKRMGGATLGAVFPGYTHPGDLGLLTA